MKRNNRYEIVTGGGRVFTVYARNRIAAARRLGLELPDIGVVMVSTAPPESWVVEREENREVYRVK